MGTLQGVPMVVGAPAPGTTPPDGLNGAVGYRSSRPYLLSL